MYIGPNRFGTAIASAIIILAKCVKCLSVDTHKPRVNPITTSYKIYENTGKVVYNFWLVWGGDTRGSQQFHQVFTIALN